MRVRICAAVLAGALFTMCPASAQAAESYDGCKGTISSLPAVIDTQGVWCLKTDLATLMTVGDAIKVNAPNVTIDCNGFKLGGLGGGPDSTAVAIRVPNAANVTVRHCHIRGFRTGISVQGTEGGHLIEDNRFDGTIHSAISLSGDGSTIRRNRVFDVGPSDVYNSLSAIYACGDVDVIDNSIRGVTGNQDNEGWYVIGIWHTCGVSGVVQDNRIADLVIPPSGKEYGIYAHGANLIVRGNSVKTTDPTDSLGIRCSSSSSMSYQNLVTGPGAISGCHDGGGNAVIP
jgi:hypothetical protein